MKKTKQQAFTATLARTTHRFTVEALDCSDCGADVRTNLRQLPGIQAVNVNVPGREIAVTFDPARVAPDDIRVKLESIGLGCS
ncbi:MAG TPA: heavy metal-associated domain-containing protein [Chloroflexota bacterium]|nr:heavy metal-associated domain-containing protein [Chloroflexota bacterium]